MKQKSSSATSPIALRRCELGLTQSELGRLVGVSYQTVSLWESQRRLPHRRNIMRLADALRCSPRDLV